MKTQLHFNIDSTEITEQIAAAITAEMKQVGRRVADQAFVDALETKMKAILDRLDNDVKNKWYGSETKRIINGKAEIRFVRGRLKFGDGKNPAPFPSMVCVFR